MKKDLNILIGKSVETRKDIFHDFYQVGQLAIAGSPGSGKSNFILSVIASLTKRYKPEELQLILADPKKSFSRYGNSQYLSRPLITQTEGVVEALAYLLDEIINRYNILQKELIPSIFQYNSKMKVKMPYIFFIADEISNFMTDDKNRANKQIGTDLFKISQMARCVGVFMILSTSHPCKAVLPERLLANLSIRLAFQLPTRKDSMFFLNRPGAEKLLGKGDGLFSGYKHKNPIEVQTPLFSK